MANGFNSRIRAVLMLSASVAVLGACTDVEYAVDRAQQGASDAYDTVFSSKTPPKSSPTKVEVTTPVAAPYQDVKTKEIETKTATDSTTAKPVELGSMHDSADLLPKDTITPTKPMDVTPPAAPLTTSKASKPAAAPAEAALKPAAAPAPVAVANDAMGAPLLVIRFNQHHVYYDDALSKAVNAAEHAKSGLTYSVVSRLPDLSALPADQQENITSRATDNLHNVVTQIQQLGVPADRIKIADQKQDVRSQEIAVFVN